MGLSGPHTVYVFSQPRKDLLRVLDGKGLKSGKDYIWDKAYIDVSSQAEEDPDVQDAIMSAGGEPISGGVTERSLSGPQVSYVFSRGRSGGAEDLLWILDEKEFESGKDYVWQASRIIVTSQANDSEVQEAIRKEGGAVVKGRTGADKTGGLSGPHTVYRFPRSRGKSVIDKSLELNRILKEKNLKPGKDFDWRSVDILEITFQADDTEVQEAIREAGGEAVTGGAIGRLQTADEALQRVT